MRSPISPTDSFGEIRVGHEDKIGAAARRQARSAGAVEGARQARTRDPRSHWITDIIACPGLDYCSLANACSIPIAKELTWWFANDEAVRTRSVGFTSTSGCIMAAAITMSAISGFWRRETRRLAKSPIGGREVYVTEPSTGHGKTLGARWGENEVFGSEDGRIVTFRAPSGTSALQREIERFRAATENGLSGNNKAVLNPLRQLYRSVVQPVEPLLDGASRILILPDGASPRRALGRPGPRSGRHQLRQLNGAGSFL